MNKTSKQIGQQKNRTKSFLKFSINLHKVLGSKSSVLLFEALEYRFNLYPEGFYKFVAPCKSKYYRKGDSLLEELGISSRDTIWKASKTIVTSYQSKALYAKSIEIYGLEGAFMGKPFLSYRDNGTDQTFYLRNAKNVKSILEGNYEKIGHVACPVKRTRSMSEKRTRACPKNGHVGILQPIEFIEEKVLIHSTKEELTKNNSLPISFSDDILPPKLSTGDKNTEQPKVGKLKKDEGNTEQPLSKELDSIGLETLTTMIDHWHVIVGPDPSSPTKSTIDNLRLAYLNDFSSSMDKWIDYCKLIITSKFLMGETDHKFKVCLAFAVKSDTISKVINGHFTLGDRQQVIYLPLKPIEDNDPLILKFKYTCHEKMGDGRYKSWIEPLVMRKDSSNQIICIAPNRWFAEYICTNDFLGLASFIKSLGIPCVVIEYEGKGGHQGVGTKIAGRIYAHSSD